MSAHITCDWCGKPVSMVPTRNEGKTFEFSSDNINDLLIATKDYRGGGGGFVRSPTRLDFHNWCLVEFLKRRTELKDDPGPIEPRGHGTMLPTDPPKPYERDILP